MTGFAAWLHQHEQRLAVGSQLLETRSGPVECCIEGSGPAVLILHGSPGGYDQALAVGHALGLKDYTLIAPSRPGYLRTPLSSGPGPGEQADVYAALLDVLRVKRVVVLAISGGGPSALQFVLRCPERCRGLVMLAALAYAYSEAAAYRAMPLPTRLRARLNDKISRSDHALRVVLGLLASDPKQANARALIASSLLFRLRRAGYANDLQQFATLPEVPAQQITTPALIVHGRADLDIPLRDAEQLARSLPRAQLVPIAGADHVAALQHQQAAAAIRNFLEGLPAEGMPPHTDES